MEAQLSGPTDRQKSKQKFSNQDTDVHANEVSSNGTILYRALILHPLKKYYTYLGGCNKSML